MMKMNGCVALGMCLSTAWACSGSQSDNSGGASSDTGGQAAAVGGSGGRSGSAAESPGTGGLGQLADPDASAAVAGSAGAETCASSSEKASLRPLYLAFVFDVSGSMGKLDYAWHDPELKWKPVVAATRAFFEDPASVDVFASLTLFPVNADDLPDDQGAAGAANDDDDDDDEDEPSDEEVRCNPETYSQFEVPMTPLPSAEFGAVLDGIEPESGGTPTLAAIDGTLGQVLPMAEADPGAEHALVLVTDGTPQDCDDNSISSVEAAVSAAAELVPTYVIGVENPPIEGAPENVTGLNAIAVAGGTEQAFIVETGDPVQTTSDFRAVVDSIRGQTVSCDVDIPDPPLGQELNPRRVKVLYASDTNETALSYDAQCSGAMSWHYDNADDPNEITLCPATCDTIRSDPKAQLSVQFECEDVIVLI